jgi:hypothetical protein
MDGDSNPHKTIELSIRTLDLCPINYKIQSNLRINSGIAKRLLMWKGSVARPRLTKLRSAVHFRPAYDLGFCTVVHDCSWVEFSFCG